MPTLMYHTVQQNEPLGRCTFSLQDIDEGSVILRETPLMAVSLSCCQMCMNPKKTIQRCSICKLVGYCSRACQLQDWKVHKQECQGIRNLLPRKLSKTMFLLLRLLNQENAVERMRELVHNQDQHSLDMLEMYMSVAMIILGLLQSRKEAAPIVDVQEAIQILCQINCNAFSICDHELEPYGIGIFPISSLFNHSCEPNCIATFEGSDMVMRSLRKIKKGEELVIAYVDIGAPTHERRKELQTSYFFTCNCSRCKTGMNDDLMKGIVCQYCGGLYLQDEMTWRCSKCSSSKSSKEIHKLKEEIDEVFQLGKAKLKSGDTPCAKNQLLVAWNLQERFLHSANAKRMRIASSLSHALIELQDYHQAVYFLEQAFQGFTKCFPLNSAYVTLEEYRLGKLYWYLEDSTKALQYLRKAYKRLLVLFGVNAEIAENLRVLIYEVEVAESTLLNESSFK